MFHIIYFPPPLQSGKEVFGITSWRVGEETGIKEECNNHPICKLVHAYKETATLFGITWQDSRNKSEAYQNLQAHYLHPVCL